MDVRQLILAVVLTCGLVCGALAGDNDENGKLYILSYPSSLVEFKAASEPLPTSEIDDLFSAILGFSISKDLSWDGSTLKSVWSRPKAVALVKVEIAGPLDIDINSDIPTYNTVMDSPANLDQLVSKVIGQYSNDDPVIVDLTPDTKILNLWAHRDGVFDDLLVTINEAEGALIETTDSLWNQYNEGNLDINNMLDLAFFAELYLLQEISKTVSEHSYLAADSVPDVYSVTLSGIRLLQMEYGSDSEQVQDAVSILKRVLTQVTQQLNKVYDNNVIVALETEPTASDRTLKRKKRDILATTAAPETDMNLADSYDADYPVFFHIILWTMVVLALTVYFIAVGMWNMDPGKDSIIYRMTSQRIKTD